MMFEYPGMPEGDDWKDGIERYNFVDGKDGFDRRIVDDLEAVGVRAYTVGELAGAAKTIPPAIPVFVDWLKNLESKVPGPETRHRSALRRALLAALDDPAAKGNPDVIDVLFDQLDRTSPPLETPNQIWTTETLARIASASDYSRMVALYRRPDAEDGMLVAIARYVGRFKRPRSREIALELLGNWIARPDAIRALAKVGGPEDAATISRYADDPNPATRRAVATALKKLAT